MEHISDFAFNNILVHVHNQDLILLSYFDVPGAIIFLVLF